MVNILRNVLSKNVEKNVIPSQLLNVGFIFINILHNYFDENWPGCRIDEVLLETLPCGLIIFTPQAVGSHEKDWPS